MQIDDFINQSSWFYHKLEEKALNVLIRTKEIVRKVLEYVKNEAPVQENPPLIINLSAETELEICSYLPKRDLLKMALNKEVRHAILERSKKYGYKGKDFAEANHCLGTLVRAKDYGYKGKDFTEAKEYLLRSISKLVEDHLIPKKCVVWKGLWPFWHFVDSEATLRKFTQFARFL